MLQATSNSHASTDWTTARHRLAELITLINSLTIERQHLQAELDRIVYPVLTLPSEITSDIFIQSIPRDSNPSRHTAPLLLTQICRQWRAIALATPSLWQSIALDDGQQYGDCGELLQMWLKHSATLPLFLSLGSNDGGQALAQSLMDASLVHCERWQEVRITSQANLGGPNKSFPNLRKVVLLDWRAIPRTTVIQNAPMLREADVVAVGGDDVDVRLPWMQLTSLKIETLASAAVCLPMLNQCSERLSRLTHRAMMLLPHNRIETFSQPHIKLEHLRFLQATFDGYSIVPHLTLPRLQQMTLSGKIASAIEPFRALLSRSSFQLQRLSFDLDKYANTRPEDLQLFLQLVPTVVDLHLMLHGVSGLHQIIHPLCMTDILPSMHTLTIAANRVRDDYGALLDVLRSRRIEGKETLKSFELTLRSHYHPESPAAYSPFPETAMQQFRDLAKAGLKTRIQLPSRWPSIVLDTFESDINHL